mgnify:CR=1 FL=1
MRPQSRHEQADLALQLVIYPVGNTGRIAWILDLGNLFRQQAKQAQLGPGRLEGGSRGR